MKEINDKSKIITGINDHKFHFLTGDVNYKNYGGKWYRLDDKENKSYTVIESVNMEDACNDIINGKYLFIINEISLSDIKEDDIKSALNCYGMEEIEIKNNDLLLLEILNGYGSSDQVDTFYSNNWIKGMERAKNY